ncbi:hypothetical protein GCM10008992_31740 [Halorubrum aquaticum]
MTTPTPDTDVEVIATDEPEPERSSFHAVYTAFDDDLEVEVIERVDAASCPHQFGHVLITRPEWDAPKKALPQNVRVDVVDTDPSE